MSNNSKNILKVGLVLYFIYLLSRIFYSLEIEGIDFFIKLKDVSVPITAIILLAYVNDKGKETLCKIGIGLIVVNMIIDILQVYDVLKTGYEAKEFFARLSNEFKDYDNVLYEIMNEPSGATTWADCKKYANEIIPIIRENTDAIILVGNPKWSADLVSVRNDPLVGYTNIMYTFHFYANDSFDQTRLTDAYDNGIPVFVTEHGGMEATGDGPMDYTSLEKWYKEMDKRNISYVAWNISNSKGSASIIKYNDSTMKDFSDEHLKEWGIYYKNHIREEMGVNNLLGN